MGGEGPAKTTNGEVNLEYSLSLAPTPHLISTQLTSITLPHFNLPFESKPFHSQINTSPSYSRKQAFPEHPL